MRVRYLRYVGTVPVPVLLTCTGLNGVENGAEDVRVVVAPLVLDDGDQTFQPHPAIDVLAGATHR